MALTNSQYDHFMRIYEKRQLDNENRLRSWISLFRNLVFDRHAGCWMEMRVRLLH